MSTQPLNDYSNTCINLAKVIGDLDVRIKMSEQNKKLRATYEEHISNYTRSISLLNGSMDIMKPMLADIQHYIAERKKESMQNINNALRLAGEIIKDSTEGIYFKLDGDEAWLSTPDDLEVDDVEGGGYRQISSTFLRSVVLAANANTLNTVLLDEIFSLVSPENSAALSLYLNVMCQDMQVISIEQKPQVYSNIDCLTYTFNKDNEYAEVTHKTVKRGGFEDAVQAEGSVQH